jgi:hypothetical protein
VIRLTRGTSFFPACDMQFVTAAPRYFPQTGAA